MQRATTPSKKEEAQKAVKAKKEKTTRFVLHKFLNRKQKYISQPLFSETIEPQQLRKPKLPALLQLDIKATLFAHFHFHIFSKND